MVNSAAQGDVWTDTIPGAVKVGCLEVWPEFVQHEDVGIDGLNGQEAAEPSPSSPADDKIDAEMSLRRGRLSVLNPIPSRS